METPNILLVDDDEINMSLLVAILKNLDVHLIQASSGYEAIELIEGKEIALALLDIRMEGMDGITLANIIQSDQSRDKVPILFISAHFHDEVGTVEVYQSGAVDFIQKPFLPKIVLSKVKVFLELYRQKNEIRMQKQHLESVVKELELSNSTLQENEALLNNIIDNLPVMLFIKEAKNLKLVRINKAGEELLGWTKEELIGKTDSDFFPPRQARSFMADDKKVLTNKMLVDVPDEQINTKHNGKRIIHTIKIPILNNKGEAVYLLGISEDITEKIHYENTLKESEKMYRAMLNASPSGIIIMNTKGQITEISDIILEIFGIENKSEFIGVHFHQLFPAKEEKKIKSILGKTSKEGLVQNIEYMLTRKNKSRLICEISTTLIQDANGRAKGFMGIIRDISQRKKIEQQLIRSERLISIGEMASGMAHEINQPLLSITLGIENLLMKMQPANDSDKVYFHNKSEKIFNDISRVVRIIDHVRAFSRDQDDMIHTLFDVNESIKNAISMISAQFKHHSVDLEVSLNNNLPWIYGDTYKLEQVILNLLNNAKDALEEKTKTSKSLFKKKIRIKSWYDKSNDYVEVSDNGSGIDKELLDMIMLPFFTTKEAGMGTGLGLSVSFGIIKEMKGNIEVESNPGSGTTFRITLPIPVKSTKNS